MGKRQVLLGLAALTMSAAFVVHAESAPVYDADSMQQQNDYGLDQGQDLPMPPPPGQEGAYVPAPSPVGNTPTVAIVQDNSHSMEQRLKHIEQQLSGLQGNTSTARVEALQKEVQTLRGQVEQLNHQAQQMQDQQKNLYADLDKRLASADKITAKKTAEPVPVASNADAAVDTKPAVKLASAKKSNKSVATDAVVEKNETAAAEVASNADQPNVAEEQQIYQTAYNQIKAKKYEDAVKTLQSMLKKYPSGQFASNAHYWLGELYGLLGKHQDALKEFNTVVKDYSDSPRVSDAQLKIGLIYAAQFNWSDAKSTFKKIINRYPGTASAKLASDQLKQIKQAGH